MPKRVLVTGCSGHFGASLVRALLAHPLVRRVVGADARPPALEPNPRLRFYPADIRDGVYLRSLLEEEEIDTVYHLAFLMGEFPARVLAHSLNVEGSLALAEAAHKTPRVRKLVIAGSASAYGARRGNRLFMKEAAPLRADSLPYGIWKRRMEEAIAAILPDLRPDLQVSVLRLCTVASASGRLAGPERSFAELPFGMSLLLQDCPMQFLSEEDLLQVLTRILEVPEFRGVYNVAPDDYTTPRALSRKRGIPHLRVPGPLLWLAFLCARRLKPSWGLHEGAVSHLAHPVVLDNTKIKRALGVAFRSGSEDAFLACARARAP